MSYVVGSWTEMGKARMMGQARKVTRAGSPRGLALSKTGKTRTYLVFRVTFPPLAHCWSCGLDPLTFNTAGHVVHALPWHAASHAG